MYLETLSKTIEEATDKLYNAKCCDFVFGCIPESLTDDQYSCLADYVQDLQPYTEDIKLALDNLYVNLTDDHLYVLEMADTDDDNIQYYFKELMP